MRVCYRSEGAERHKGRKEGRKEEDHNELTKQNRCWQTTVSALHGAVALDPLYVVSSVPAALLVRELIEIASAVIPDPVPVSR